MSTSGSRSRRQTVTLGAAVFALTLAGSATAARAQNSLTPAEQAAGWQLLFDGKTFTGWRCLGFDTVLSARWMIQDGTIRKIPSGEVPLMADGRPVAGADLMTVGTYRDFELSFEWKVAPAANGGVKYNVSEEISRSYPPGHSALGFEYQVLDDALHPDGKLPIHRAASLYDLIAPNPDKRLEPVGEWNTARIVLRGNHGEHWLNGEKVVEYDLGTPAMDTLLARSKYRSIKGFADRRAGHIVLQDHVDEVWYRNLKIRDLTQTASH
jgi:hypothetical protein